MKYQKISAIVVIGLLLASCGASGTSTTSSASGDAAIGAAVGSIFGSTTSQSQSALKKVTLPQKFVALLIREAQAASGAPSSACDAVNQVPSDVTAGLSITAGTYGTSSNAKTVTTADGCDQGGEYASFTVASHQMTCQGSSGASTTLTMENSHGVWRENTTSNLTEIYGVFGITVGGNSSSNINCSFTITHGQGSEGVFSGSCEDSSGNPVTQDSDQTCSDA